LPDDLVEIGDAVAGRVLGGVLAVEQRELHGFGVNWVDHDEVGDLAGGVVADHDGLR
jgi:hypothetical protein